MPNQPKIERLLKTTEFWRFVEWSGLPSSERKPLTQQNLAIELKIDNATLSDWKKVEGFWDEVKNERKKWARDKVSNVLLGLYGRALKQGSAAEVKLFLEYADEFTESLKLIQKKELSDEDKELLSKAIDYGNRKTATKDNREPDNKE